MQESYSGITKKKWGNMSITGDAAIKQAMAAFCTQHKTVLHEPYMVSWGKDQKIMKGIVDTYGSLKTYLMIVGFFQAIQEDEFLKKTGASVGIFKTQLPKLLMGISEKKKEEGVGRL